mgnify:CR=1 FL=1
MARDLRGQDTRWSFSSSALSDAVCPKEPQRAGVSPNQNAGRAPGAAIAILLLARHLLCSGRVVSGFGDHCHSGQHFKRH